ncbi:Os06g0294775 [Oryza sativa Japonica Group]|uniref:Os06g0294775 protein n=1 Tax=Oryza sativa subsp. japonica TaxID=39947 RepID=A0A0N7KLY7_ORYSJ|nr:hypothetical protein EE612_033476 [Oryza sativa]BAS97329.1 Os06g0294775 [Oryza sativa Japonica Group]
MESSTACLNTTAAPRAACPDTSRRSASTILVCSCAPAAADEIRRGASISAAANLRSARHLPSWLGSAKMVCARWPMALSTSRLGRPAMPSTFLPSPPPPPPAPAAANTARRASGVETITWGTMPKRRHMRPP